MDQEEIKSALKRAAKGLTARQMLGQCESYGDVNEVVKDVHALKAAGKIKADGMRDSQVVYKMGDWDGEEKPAEEPTPQPKAPQTLPAVKARRTGSGLREGLFDMMERLRDGKVDVGTAKTYAALAMTICKSIEVQLEYERMKVSKELPGELGDMTMVPALESK